MCTDGSAHHSQRERLLRAERNRSGCPQEGGSEGLVFEHCRFQFSYSSFALLRSNLPDIKNLLVESGVPAKSTGTAYRPVRREKSTHKTKFPYGHQLRPLNRSSVLPIAQRMSQKKTFEIQKARDKAIG
jgi:hypothetical protein